MSTPLSIASSKGHIDAMILLINYGADPTTKNAVWQTGPIYEASRHGHIEAVRLLLDQGVDVDGIDYNKHLWNDSCTPLHYAIYDAQDIDIVRLLVERGADINRHNNCDRCTPLDYANRLGLDVIASYLRSVNYRP